MLVLLKKGIIDEFQSDFLLLPWKVRRQLLEPIEELYEDDPLSTTLDIYKALFYYVYGDNGVYVEDNPPASVFQHFKAYRAEWVNVDIMDLTS